MTGSFEALIPRDLRAEVPERIGTKWITNASAPRSSGVRTRPAASRWDAHNR
jgi:hypothetical protein